MSRYSPADQVFPTDRPIDAAVMIGRDEETGELASALANGLNRIMVGPRRMGKTTLCRAAMAAVGDVGLYVAEVDLFGIPTLESLAEHLVDAVVANRSTMARARRSIAKGGRSAVSAVSLSAVAHLKVDLGEDLALALEPSFGRREPMLSLEKALGMAQRICEVDDRRLVLFIDEFQELAGPRHPFGDPDRVTKAMRTVLQDSDRVTTLFAGSIEHMMRDLFGPSQRAFYQWGGWHQLWPIESETWQAGISERFAAHGLALDPDAARYLLELSEGHARVTMLLAKQAYLAAITGGERVVGRSTVGTALEMAMAADSLFHDNIVEEVRSLGRHVLDVALRIARGDPPYAQTNARAAQRAIEALAGKGLLEKTGPSGRGGWRIVDPLLRRYLAGM